MLIKNMSKFYCHFLDQALGVNPKLENYSDFFLNYHPSKWKIGCGDGVFSFENEDGDSAVLSVIESEIYGISVRYNFRKGGQKENHEFYSVSDRQMMNQVEDVGDDQFVPVGSFLKPNLAWLAVEDFLENPLQKSVRIDWANSKDISGFPS